MTRKLVSQANVLVFAAIIGFLALIGFTTWDRFVAARSARDWTTHTYAVLAAAGKVEIAVRDAETGQRGYLLTGDKAYLEPYESALGQMPDLLADLQRLTADNAVQQARLSLLAPAWQRRSQQFVQNIQAREDKGLSAAAAILQTGGGRETMT
ncbi:MAG TPA: CHASE3 domain-containing protein, partial [Rhodopila sp.]